MKTRKPDPFGQLGNDQKRTVGVREGEQERGWNPLHDHTPMEEVSAGAASSVMTTSASGIQEIKSGVCEKVVKSSVLALASSDDHTRMEETIAGSG